MTIKELYAKMEMACPTKRRIMIIEFIGAENKGEPDIKLRWIFPIGTNLKEHEEIVNQAELHAEGFFISVAEKITAILIAERITREPPPFTGGLIADTEFNPFLPLNNIGITAKEAAEALIYLGSAFKNQEQESKNYELTPNT